MGNIPLMKLLLANNANINVQGGTERMTVLHEAILNENSDESLIEFLLENGADPHIEYILISHRKFLTSFKFI
jgi:ankyrin repeat protein